MKLQKLVCLEFDGSELDEKYWQKIDKLTESRELLSGEALPKTCKDTDGLLVKLGANISKELIDNLPNLRYIGMLGTGYGGIDVEYATTKNVVVTNIADYATEGVAEFTFAILLAYLRKIPKAQVQAKVGNYSDDFNGVEIKGKKFGIIGLGDIGKRTAELAQAFGAEVSYWSKNRKENAERKDIKYKELSDLLSQSDIITINLALNSATEGIIGPDRINLIKPNAILINPSPMELINFEALIKRLKDKDMIFMLDHSDEMTKEQLQILQSLSNCIVYPPIAYLTREASQLKKQIYVDNLKNFLAGNPINKVN